MQLRVYSPVALVLSALLWTGCGDVRLTPSPTPTPMAEEVVPTIITPVPEEATPPPHDAASGTVEWSPDLVEACKSYMDLDLVQAYHRFDGPILWTFHTNFYDPTAVDDPSDEYETAIDPPIRLGCLRFFWRSGDETWGRFIGTLDSAVIVKCTRSAHGTLETHTLSSSIESSNGGRGENNDKLPHRQTFFEGGAHLTCPLDITASLLEISGKEWFFDADLRWLTPDEQTTVSQVIADANPIQSYPEFMMAAALESGSGWSEQTTTPILTTPILFYTLDHRKIEELGITTPPTVNDYDVEFSLLQPESSRTFFRTTLAATPYLSVNLDTIFAEEDNCFAVASPLYLWVDFGRCSKDWKAGCSDIAHNYLGFLSRAQGEPPFYCPSPIPSDTIHKTIPFWTGPATVYIGHNPNESEFNADGITFYEVWIDPDSSVRPD